MKNFIVNLSTSKVGLVVGKVFITLIFIVTLVDDFLLANFVISGDTEALASHTQTIRGRFSFAVIGYLFVLALDAIIGLALHVIQTFKQESCVDDSTSQVALRLYVDNRSDSSGVPNHRCLTLRIRRISTIPLFCLAHLVPGYSVKSEYIPKSLGVLLVVTSFTYIVFFADFNLSDTVEVITMFTIAVVELSLSIWLIVKRNWLPEKLIQ